MGDRAEMPTWEACGATVRGTSHGRSGRPNQDALWHAAAGAGGMAWAAAAVADGHGSSPSFRSDRGSRLAVAAAAACLADFAAGYAAAADLDAVGRTASVELPRAVVRLWQEAVDGDL